MEAYLLWSQVCSNLILPHALTYQYPFLDILTCSLLFPNIWLL